MSIKTTRKLPKKTIFWITFMCIIFFGGFMFLNYLKNLTFIEILNNLGHKNINNIKVINKLDVEDVQSKLKSSVFKVAFYDKDLNKSCVGFLHQEKDGTYTKDIDCK